MKKDLINSKAMVYDTTMRDGEQTPGVRFSVRQKIRLATMLDELGLPEIEAGFPAVSREEQQAVGRIATMGLDADISALSRTRKDDIDKVVDSGAQRIILFTSISPLHLRYKLRKTMETVTSESIEAVEYARMHGLRVSFSSEDATRTDPGTLRRFYSQIEESGAHRLHIADTAGVATPHSIGPFVGEIRSELKESTQICIHCHNDLGLATANALCALAAGADVAGATVNGIGERAGNVPLEELLMSLTALYGVKMPYDLKILPKLSRLVEEYSGIEVQTHKPIVGENAFSHESGIHVAAVLENPLTYEPFDPGILGLERKIVLGKHSGKRAVIAKLREKGNPYSQGDVERILHEVKSPLQKLTRTFEVA